MSLKDRIDKIKSAWKQITVLGTWIGTIAASILMPLPQWGSDDEHSARLNLLIFLSSVIAGYVIILTYKIQNKPFWVVKSIVFLMLFVIFQYRYTDQRQNLTRPYLEENIVIGSTLTEEAPQVMERLGITENTKDILKYVGGDNSRIWTKQSIKSNRMKLVFGLTLSYCLLSIFLVAFVYSTLICIPSRSNQ